MANPPFSTDPIESIPPLDPDYVAKYAANNDRFVNEILDLNTRLMAISGLTPSQTIALTADAEPADVTAPLVFISSTGGWVLRGITAREDLSVTFYNTGAEDVIFAHNDADAASDIVLIDQAADYYLPPGEKVVVTYDKVAAVWRMSVKGRIQKLTLLVTTADLVALGAVNEGSIDFPRALPAGALPTAFRCRNGGTAFTSSAGTPLLLAGAVASGQTALWNIGGLIEFTGVDVRFHSAISFGSVVKTTHPFEDGFTPAVSFENTGAGTFANLTDGDDGVIFELFYVVS